MKVELPDFVTNSFLQKIFDKNYADGKFKVASFWGEWATKKGDNYASDMYRIHVDFESSGGRGTKPVLLKLMPSGEIQVVVMVKNNIYPREIQAYSEFLLKSEELLMAANDETKFAPKCLYTSYEPKCLLIFEDMKEQGYKVFPRGHQLNFEEALPIIVKLAKLHATSRVIYESDPSVMDLYREGSISANPERQDFLVHYRNCARTLGSIAEKEWGAEWKAIADKLKKLADTIVQKGYELYTRDESAFNVFCHNDLWTPNILVKFDESEKAIDDILFVDFQLSYFGSPGIDLNFFLYGMLSEEARIGGTKKLVRIYHKTLTETLAKLNFKKRFPTLHDIHVEMLKTGFNGVLAAIAEVPLLIIEQSDNLQMDMLIGNSAESEAFRFSLFNNPKYKPFIQTLLVEFDDLGYLE